MLIFFIFLSFLSLGLYIILTNNPIHAVFGLILIFFLSALISIFLGFDFLAFLILIIYVGAISVLFLFVVMLLNIRILELNVSLIKYWWLGIFYSFGFIYILLYEITSCLAIDNSILYTANKDNFVVNYVSQLYEWNSISQIGEIIFLYNFYMLIIAAIILLIAVISPVMLCFKKFKRFTYECNNRIYYKNNFF